MSDKLLLTGMVLSAAPVGDFDKRVVILTKERGKITAFARGARRQNSALLAASNPFCFGIFQFYQGRSAYTLVQAEVQNYFRELTLDLENSYYGFYFLEFADYYTRENNDEAQMLKLLYTALRGLVRNQMPRELIRYTYELRAMTINGEYPQVFACVKCGKKEGLGVYQKDLNGVVCEKCAAKLSENSISYQVQMEESTVYTMQYVISTPVEKLFSFAVTPQVLREFADIMDGFRQKYIDKTFKSLDILQSICNY